MAALKNAQKYTEQLDTIASEVQATSPELAYHIDAISDVIDGRREASTLKFDADEARYMAGRFNFKVQKREADEPYMDSYNKNDFSQVNKVFQSPVPIKKANVPYTKVTQ
jgi:hypothetical protein